jgi:hypothetical protein
LEVKVVERVEVKVEGEVKVEVKERVLRLRSRSSRGLRSSRS